MISRTGCTSGKKRKMFGIKFIFDGILHNVFNDWSPTAHLVSLLRDSFFTWYCIYLFAIAL